MSDLTKGLLLSVSLAGLAALFVGPSLRSNPSDDEEGSSDHDEDRFVSGYKSRINLLEKMIRETEERRHWARVQLGTTLEDVEDVLNLYRAQMEGAQRDIDLEPGAPNRGYFETRYEEASRNYQQIKHNLDLMHSYKKDLEHLQNLLAKTEKDLAEYGLLKENPRHNPVSKNEVDRNLDMIETKIKSMQVKLSEMGC